MFVSACDQIRESISGLKAQSAAGAGQLTIATGTAFAIAPGVVATAAHICHINNDASMPRHAGFEVIRSPDIGQPMESASLIAEDTVRDIALLRIAAPRSSARVALNTDRVATGTECGSLGFPLASIVTNPAGNSFNLLERFQGAYVSAFHPWHHPSGTQMAIYETDRHMYSGSSGCPAFLGNGEVFAMHVASQMDPAAGRLAISLWVPAHDIRQFAEANGITT